MAAEGPQGGLRRRAELRRRRAAIGGADCRASSSFQWSGHKGTAVRVRLGRLQVFCAYVKPKVQALLVQHYNR